MAETDTDAADQYDARLSRERMDEHLPGLWQRYRRLPRTIIAISFVSLLNDASSEIIYPLLALYLTALGTPILAVGLIEGAAESISSFLKLFSGYFSDRRGRRKGLVVFGYALAGLARPLLAFASNWDQVFAVRLADRVGKGIRSAPRDAMIADSAEPQTRGLAFGFHRAMDHAGAVVGPLLGFLLILWIAADRNAPTADEYARVFLWASVPALAAVLVAIFFVRERQRKPQRPGDLLLEKPRFTLRGLDSNFKRFLLILALFTLSNSSDVFLVKRAHEAGIGVFSIPLLWAALHAVKVLSSLVGGDLSDRLGRRALIGLGWLVRAGVYLGLAFVQSAGMAWLLFMIYGLYFGLAEGAEKALVADLVAPEQRGTAYGLYNLAFSLTVLPASLLMGTLWELYGPQLAFSASAGLSAFAALLLLTLVRVSRRDVKLAA